jgi:2-hydroxychromene-2-carboxylate isomerase
VTVEFFFAPGSRYSYLAASQMPALERETGATVRWRPVSGVDIRRLRGHDPFEGAAVSGQYDWAYRRYDAECWADLYGIPFRDPGHEVDFGVLTRAAMAADRLGAGATCGWRLCQAVYGSDASPLDEALCLRLAVECGLDRDAFARALHDPGTARLLVENAHEAHRRGAFGVPTFFLGERMFWGNDRLVILRHVLAREAAR